MYQARSEKERFYSYIDRLKLLAEVDLHHHVISLRQGEFEHCGKKLKPCWLQGGGIQL